MSPPRISGYTLVTLALITAHLAGAHSTWALGRPGMQAVRVAAFWVGLPLIWIGLEMRVRSVFYVTSGKKFCFSVTDDG